jgi:hypothetical protein
MDKMLVSPDGEVIITNDGATILEKMEVSLLKSIILSSGDPGYLFPSKIVLRLMISIFYPSS